MKVKKIKKTSGYSIVNSVGHLIAEGHNTKHCSNIFNNLIFEFGDTYGIKIYNLEIDKKMLLSLIIAIDWIQYLKYLSNLSF